MSIYMKVNTKEQYNAEEDGVQCHLIDEAVQ